MPLHLRQIKSYVCRDGRVSEAQKIAYANLWPLFGLNSEAEQINLATVFGREAPCRLEIGFGTGQSLLKTAKENPHENFIGIEMYYPGIAALLLGIQQNALTNIRIYYADAVKVIESCIPPHSLESAQIFFPDPWPKRRHHKRRLIQVPFISKLIKCIKNTGTLHIATDWKDYATHIQNVLSYFPTLSNQHRSRSELRPIITKFEQRGLNSNRIIFDFLYSVG